MRVASLRLAALLGALLSSTAGAQSAPSLLPSSTLLLNGDRVLVGRDEGIESGAYTARVSDAAAIWYNPAGLANVERFRIDFSSSNYELTRVELRGVDGGAQQTSFSGLPGFIGIVLGPPVLESGKWRVGLALTTQRAWRASLDSAIDVSQAEQVAFSSNTALTTTTPSIALGYTLSPGLRVGLGLEIPITSLIEIVTFSNSLNAAGESLLRNLRLGVTTWHGLLTAGIQWEVASCFVVGAMLKTPGVRLFNTGLFAFQNLQTEGASSMSLSAHDDSAHYDFPVPFQANFGVAYQTRRGGVEADVRFHAGTHTRSLIHSDQVMTSIVSGVEAQLPFPEVPFQLRPVANVAVGGHIGLSQITKLHAGFFTDLSPIAIGPTPALFPQVNLWGVTAGASFSGEQLSASLGVALTWGTSKSFPLAADREPLTETQFLFRIATAMVSLTYRY